VEYATRGKPNDRVTSRKVEHCRFESFMFSVPHIWAKSVAPAYGKHEFGADAAALAMFNSILNRILVRVSLDYK
jgi:hypothetical protein